jgi:WD40 repeat protein
VETLADAYQFARHNLYIADLAPLQLYASALVFAPDISIIKMQFKPCMPSWLLNTPKVEASWPGDMLKLEGHTAYTTAMSFSLDDKILGTCSQDGTTRLWDTTDASCSLTVSRGKGNYCPKAIAFSSDTSKFAVAYIYARKNPTVNVEVTIYQTKTGTPLKTTRSSESLSNELRLAVAFEEDDHDHDAIVAVVTHTDQVHVWRSVNDSSILLRAWTSRFPKKKSRSTIDVAISQDASLICCSGVLDESGESSISALDSKTGAVISEHKRDKGFGSMSFSGSTLVCQRRQEAHTPENPCSSLRGFDFETLGPFTHLAEYHGLWCNFSLANAKDRVAFNPDDNEIIHLEKIPESKTVGRRTQGWLKRLVTVAPRGDLVADWNNGRLTVLDTKGLVTQRVVSEISREENIQWPGCLAISPDCRYVALGHEMGVTVWDIRTGERSQYSEIEAQLGLAFSNDNSKLACACGTQINAWDVVSPHISVWDLKSERKLLLADSHIGWSVHLEFSADGQDLLIYRDRFHIATGTWTPLPDLTTLSMFGKGVHLNGDATGSKWVQFECKNLIWIPDAYRADFERGDARGGTVALGQGDGSVMVLTFDLSML